MYDAQVGQLKEEVTRREVVELRTPSDVDTLVRNARGPILIFLDSSCGCAGAVARPALVEALRHPVLPEVVATIFASTEREATARAREYFANTPPSSPCFAMLRDGRLLEMIHRSEIKSGECSTVAAMLISMFDRYCSNSPAH